MVVRYSGDSDHLLQQLWQVCDKPERLRAFHALVLTHKIEIGAEKFWHNFWQIWTSSENLNEDATHIEELVEKGLQLGQPWVGLDEDERAALAALPERITVYRGCTGENKHGWSWTLKPSVARNFAERAYSEGVSDRFVLSTVVDKGDVLGYLTGRDEEEIVLDPDGITNLKQVEHFQKDGSSVGFFYAIQSGKFRDTSMDEARATMMARTAHAPFDDILNHVDARIAFMQMVGSTAQLGYMKALKAALEKRRDHPEADDVFEGFSL